MTTLRSILLLLLTAVGCSSSTTVSSYVQPGWVGTFEDQWFVRGTCRPREAEPAGVLAATPDGRWVANAPGDTRVPCGTEDAVEVHVRDADHLVITAPAVVHPNEVFSVHVTAYDRDDHLLHRNAEAAVWELGTGLEPGDRESCMDIRSGDGDSELVQATVAGPSRIRVALAGVEAHADVTVTPASP